MIKIFKDWADKHFSDPQKVILGFLILMAIGIFYAFGNVLTPVFISIVIAYLLEGMVGLLQKWKLPRLPAVVIVFFIFMTCLIVLTLWLLPLLSRQVSQLVQQLPGMLSKGQAQLMQLPIEYPDLISESQVKQIFEFLDSGLSSFARRLLSLSIASVLGLITLIIYLVLVPLLVFFFLKDKEMILSWGKTFLPENLEMAKTVWHEANVQIANYIRGKGWEILIIWGITFAVFQLMGMQFSLLVSLFCGLSVILPYIGVTIMGIVVAVIAFFQWGWSGDFGYAVAAYSVIQIFDGNILAPLLLSGVVDIHPVAIIVAVLLFGGLWGVWGLFFAIPLATLVNAVVKAWFKRLDEKSDQPDESGAG